MRYSLIILFIFIGINSQAQYKFQYGLDIPFEINNQQLARAGEGGLNSAQFQTMDVDLDGDLDLVIYNRMSADIQVYLNTDNQYIWAPELAYAFPEEVVHWLILKDYDCDGDKDLFTSTALGIKVFENVSAESLAWEEAEAFLTFDNGSNIQVSPSDIPGIEDINGDGALDILTYRFGTGTTIDYFQNTGTCGSLSFTRAERQWGDILECGCNDFKFGGSCGFNEVGRGANDGSAAQHLGGKTLLPFDFDNDGDMDIITSDELCETLYFMENVGTADNARMTSFVSYPVNNPAGFPFFPSAFLEDIDFDNQKELIISTNADQNLGNAINFTSHIQVYEDNSSQNISFDAPSIPFLQSEMLDLGENAFPAFTDFDDDGDLDLFIGTKGTPGPNGFGGSIYQFENVGNVFSPSYQLVTDDFLDLRKTNYSYYKPFFFDTDGDGDEDLVYQATLSFGNTRFFYRKNNGDFQFTDSITLNIESNLNDNPFFHDVNRDGAPDLLLGTQFGGLSVYYNSGTMSFTTAFEDFGGIENDFDRQNLSVYVADIDNDGIEDLVTLDDSGQVTIYEGPVNDGFEANEPIADVLEIDESLKTTLFGRQSIIAVADLRGNDLPALFIGSQKGGFYALSNISENTNGGEENEIIVQLAPNPASEVLRVSANVNGQIDLYNIHGQRVLKEVTVTPQTSTNLNISNISRGVYILRVSTPNGEYNSKKVIVLR